MKLENDFYKHSIQPTQAITMSQETTRYLLNQQRISFKQNWRDELEHFVEEVIDKLEINELADAQMWKVPEDIKTQLDKSDIDWVDWQYMYHNLVNQSQQDCEWMIADIVEEIEQRWERDGY